MTYDANLFVGKDLHSDELQIHCFIIKTYVVNENISSIALSMAYDCTMLTFLWEKIYTRFVHGL